MIFQKVKIGSICTLVNGIAFKSGDFQEEGIPVLKIANVKANNILLDNLQCVSEEIAEKKKKGRVYKGDILLTMTGNRKEGGPDSWVGKAALFRENGHYMLNQRLCIVRPDTSKVNTEYLAYYLSSWDAQLYFINHSTSSGGQANISPAIINDYEVALPSLEIQRKIAHVLTMMDLKIRANVAINRNLSEQAETLFKSWFEDYEPWNGEMPADWKQGVLGDFVTIKRGGSPRPIQEYLSDEGLRWLKISDVSGLQSPYVLEIAEHIIEAGLKKTVYLEAGSLVLSNSATPGIPKILDVDSCIHDGWLYFPESQLSNYFLYLFYKSIRPKLVALGNGSVFTNLKTDILKGYSFLKPDNDTLYKFDEIVAPMFRMMREVARENQRLSELRDSVLPKLMSGELNVSDLDI